MRITIDVDGAQLRSRDETRQDTDAQKHEQAPVEDVDAGAPSAELIETLAMEGALAPIMSAFQPLGNLGATSAGASAAEPTRGTWESGTLMRKRRD